MPISIDLILEHAQERLFPDNKPWMTYLTLTNKIVKSIKILKQTIYLRETCK